MTEGSSFTLNTSDVVSCIECCSCGIKYLVPEDWKKGKKTTLDTFYCPNGHSQSYTKSTAIVLQEKIDKLARESSGNLSRAFEAENKVKLLEKQVRKFLKKKKGSQ